MQNLSGATAVDDINSAMLSGSIDAFTINDGFIVILNKAVTYAPQQLLEVAVTKPDWLMLRVILRGELDEGTDGKVAKLNYNSSFLDLSQSRSWQFVMSPEPFSSVIILIKKTQLNTKFKATNKPALLQVSSTPLLGLRSSIKMLTLANEMIVIEARETMSNIRLEGMALLLLVEAMQNIAPAQGCIVLTDADTSSLYAVKDKLVKECTKAHNLHDLSQWAGINRRKLTQGFKLLFGCTVQQFLTLQKMVAATALLEHKDRIGDVANAVGYGDVASFSRAFKRFYGYPPKQHQAASK